MHVTGDKTVVVAPFEEEKDGVGKDAGLRESTPKVMQLLRF